jgi:DNA-binding transcriptional LysR family regulator
MKSLKGISSFVAAAGAGSFAAAAKLQGVSAVAVGKNIATLERQLNVRLIQRTTRKLSLTPEGSHFYRQCIGPLRELETAQATIEQSARSLSGLVRVTSVAPFATGYLLPLIQQFHEINPRVQIELHLDDSVSDMVGQGYDVGIRVGRLKSSSLIARPIAPLPFVVCASADYLKRKLAPLTLADLASHNCLRLSRISSRDPMPWFIGDSDTKTDLTIMGNLTGNLLLNDFSALRTAAIQGMGLACLPLPLVMPDLRANRLVPVLTQHIRTDLLVYLHYPNRKNLPQRTRSFIDFVLTQLEKEKDLHTQPHALLSQLSS